jgi:hypothetical protein
MSWNDVHRYYEALHRAEDDLNRTGDGRITWHDDYEEVFGTPQRLAAALRSYWNNLVRAQIECSDPQNWRRIMDLNRLAAAHPGLATAVARAATTPTRSDLELAGAA